MLAALGQLDPSLGPLPGYVPEVWNSPRVSKQAVPAGPFDYSRVPDTTDYVAWAVMDLELRKVSQPGCAPYLWYIAIPPWGDVKYVESCSFVMNSTLNMTDLIVTPELSASGWLMVWDLRKLCPDPHDLERALIVRNAFHIKEPYFHAEYPVIFGGSIACRAFKHTDGRVYHGRKFVPAPHVERAYALLEHETQCFAPLLRADDFLRRMSSTIEGGLYYHAIGFIRHGKRLNQDEIFKLIGLDTAVSRGVRGDDRAAMFQSAVTGKARVVEQVQGAIGTARITVDIFTEDTGPERHAIYQLLDNVAKGRGKEIIFERANGLFGYLLTDGAGKLVDVAPPNLVSDHRVPDPHEKQLFPMMSCVRCHGPTGGIQLVRNDIPQLLGGGVGDLDFFDDVKSHADRYAIVDRITGLYAAGDTFQVKLQESRNRYADAVFRATKGSGIRGEVDVATRAAEVYSRQISEYWYADSPVHGNMSADEACLELGTRVKTGEGAAVLRQIVPYNRADVIIDGRPVEFADPAIGALKQNLTIRRQDWERVYPYAAYQAVKQRGVK